MLYVGDPMRHLATVGVLCLVCLEACCHPSLGLGRVCHGRGSERPSLACCSGWVPTELAWRMGRSGPVYPGAALEDQPRLARQGVGGWEWGEAWLVPGQGR